MFATTTQVKTITGKIVNAGLVERAQYAIEAYVGKFEVDITDTNDLEILKRAVAYQSAYMLNNEDMFLSKWLYQLLCRMMLQQHLSLAIVSHLSLRQWL